jgi:hypothetical protein
MSQHVLESFGAYQKTRQLFDLVMADMETLKTNPLCYRLRRQEMCKSSLQIELLNVKYIYD